MSTNEGNLINPQNQANCGQIEFTIHKNLCSAKLNKKKTKQNKIVIQ